jgi:hypothetical protein
MQQSNNVIFNSSNGNTSAWINVGLLAPGSTFNIVGLESDGKLQVNLSNSVRTPAASDPSIVLGSTINGIAAGAAQLIVALTIPVQWLQIVKLPGAAPTNTTVTQFGQIF